VVALLALGCGGERRGIDIPKPDPLAAPADVGADAGDADAAATTGPLGEVTITPLAAPPAPERMPKLAFLSPKAGEAVSTDKADAFEVRLEIKDWYVAPGDHVHLVLDNKPYRALEDGRTSIKLGDVFPSEPLAEGQHVLVAFPARGDHLSVKPDKGRSPLAMVGFWVGKGGKTPAWKPGDPMLVYSRPKGTYNGRAADEVLLDFYLAGVDLGEGRSSIRATVSPQGAEAARLTITRWSAFTVANLPNGTTRVLLEVLDKDGKPIVGPFGRAEQEVSINRAAP
jgi:hypothetical protein